MTEQDPDHFPFGKPKLSRRQEILRAASDLFSQHGVQAVTTRQIAAKVGISQPSLYAHFKSVQQIHEELSANAFELLAKKGAKALEEGHGYEQLLRATIRNFFEFGMSNPVAYKIAFIVEAHKEKAFTQAEYEQTDHPGVRAFASLNKVVSLVRPDLDQPNVALVAKLLWATLHGLISLLLMRNQFPWGNVEELIEQQSEAAFAFVMNYRQAG